MRPGFIATRSARGAASPMSRISSALCRVLSHGGSEVQAIGSAPHECGEDQGGRGDARRDSAGDSAGIVAAIVADCTGCLGRAEAGLAPAQGGLSRLAAKKPETSSAYRSPTRSTTPKRSSPTIT